jgi:hypothetical protein
MPEGYVENITDISIKAERIIDSQGKSFVTCEFTPDRAFELLTLLEFLRYRILSSGQEQRGP